MDFDLTKPKYGNAHIRKVLTTSFTNFAKTHQAKSHFNLFGLLHLWRLFQTRSQSAVKWTMYLAIVESDQVGFTKTVKITAIHAVNIFLWEVQLVETVLSNKVQSLNFLWDVVWPSGQGLVVIERSRVQVPL